MARLAEAQAFVDARPKWARRTAAGCPGGEAQLAVGLAGTVSTVAALEKEVGPLQSRTEIHHSSLSGDQVDVWRGAVGRRGLDSRPASARRPGMVEGRGRRESVIVGGVLVLAAVMAGFGRRECLVSEDDILDGIVASLR